MTVASDWAEPLAYRPGSESDPEPPYAIADAWTPPHPLAVPADLCDRLRDAAQEAPRRQHSLSGTYISLDLEPADEREVLDRVAWANAAWWSLAVTDWHLVAKRYRQGDEHAEHQDLYGGAARRKVGAIVQLSDPGEYDGGALRVRIGDQYAQLPRERGTLAVWPSWTLHGVEPITRGERWALAVFGYGPPLR